MNRFFSAVLFIYLFISPAFSQSLNTEFVNSLSEDSIRSYLYVLTSDSLAGRETGQPGQKKAAAYLASKYASWNIPVQVQKHSMSVRANSGKNLAVNGKYFIYYNDFFYLGPPKDTLLIVNRFHFAGFGISSPDYNDLGKEAEGSDVVVRWKEPQWKKKFRKGATVPMQLHSLSEYVKLISSGNPRSVFVVVDSIPQVISQTESDPVLQTELRKTKFPVIFVNEKTAENFIPHDSKKFYSSYLKKLERKRKPFVQHRETETSLKFVSDTKTMLGENIFAVIEGRSKKDEYVIISSHYDHLGIRDSSIYYGADDNASGTSAILEMARVFRKASEEGAGPERSIVFMNVSGEEKGLLGSSFYVKHPIVPLSSTVANLNIDMIGRIDDKHDSLKVRDYVYLIGADRLSKELAEINVKANSEFTKLELDSAFDNDTDPNRYYQRSDHYNFAKNNIPVIFYFNGVHADYHKPTDTADKIKFSLLRKRAQLVFLTAWELVNRKERIRLN